MKKQKFLKLLLTLFILLTGCVFILPLLWMASTSLKNMQDVYVYPIDWIPDVIRWSNYQSVFNEAGLPMMLLYGNSIKVTALAILGNLTISALAAYAFAKMKFRGHHFVFVAFLASMMIPDQVTIIPRFLFFNQVGLYNTHLSIILPRWFSVTAIFLLKQFYEAVPNELSEAAYIDGASHFRIWMRVMLPLTMAPMASLVVLEFITSWNDYMNPLIFLVRKNLYTVSLGVNYYYTQDTPLINLTMAAAVCAVMPVLLLFLFCQKYFIESIAASGIKG